MNLSILLVVVGVLLVAAGAWFIYPPAGMVVLGACCVAAGLFFVDVGGGQ